MNCLIQTLHKVSPELNPIRRLDKLHLQDMTLLSKTQRWRAASILRREFMSTKLVDSCFGETTSLERAISFNGDGPMSGAIKLHAFPALTKAVTLLAIIEQQTVC